MEMEASPNLAKVPAKASMSIARLEPKPWPTMTGAKGGWCSVVFFGTATKNGTARPTTRAVRAFRSTWKLASWGDWSVTSRKAGEV